MQRLVEGVHAVPEDGLQHLDLRPRPGQRDHLHGLTGGLGQPGDPGQHRVPDRRRHPRRARRQHLGDEERVAPGDPVELVGVGRRPGRVATGVVLHQGAHGLRRQRRQVHPTSPGHRRGVPDDGAQRMGRRHLVRPVRDQDQRAAAVDPAGQVSHEIQRRLVGPVGVLDHEQVGLTGPRLPQGAHQPGEELLPRGALGPDVIGQVRQHLHERTERRRGRRPVAPSGRHPGGGADLSSAGRSRTWSCRRRPHPR